MSDSRNCEVITPQRTLRNRDANQTKYRPRPALTSSARGIAKQEVRRQRELEANEEFSKANEKLQNGRKASSRNSSSSSQESQAIQSHSSQNVTHMEASLAHTFATDRPKNSQKGQNNKENSLSQLSHTSSSEEMVEDLLSKVVPAETIEQSSADTSIQTPQSRKRTIEDIEGLELVQDTSLTGESDQLKSGSVAKSDNPPPSKKKNVTLLEFDDDSGYWDDMDMDWDALDQIDTSDTQAPVPPASESEGVFRWANKNKEVTQTAKAAHAKFRLQQYLEEEGEEESPASQAGFTQPEIVPRTPFRPIGPSRLNQSITNRNEEDQASSSKVLYKVNEINASTESPTPTFRTAADLRTPNAASQGVRLTLQRSHVTNSTPRKREVCYGNMVTGGQKIGRLSQTPLPRKSFDHAIRQGRSSLPKFKSPFKKDTQTSTHAIHATFSPLQKHSLSNLSQTCVKSDPEKGPSKVFDLDKQTKPRLSLREAEKSTKWTWNRDSSFEQSEDFEIISKILNDPPSAVLFSFTDAADPDGVSSLGISAARKELAQAVGCSLDKIGYAWVKNHWSMILWKLAALANRSEEYGQMFSWNETINQLRYRYEREVNHAHRSAIKRIQEHDSPAALPMILCVYDASHGADENESHLVLTDGWYRVHVPLDPVLSRAVRADRIKRGQKLAIIGARLDPESSACEPIEAFDTSPLLICGNGCKLAPWDARLGVQKEPFASSIRSLTVDGGFVSILDAVVTKVYPKGYLSAIRSADPEIASNSGSSQHNSQQKEIFRTEIWDEREEEEKQNEWHEKRRSTVDDIRKSLQFRSQKLVLVTELLADKCQQLDESMVIDDVDPNSCEGFLDAMLASENPSDYAKNAGIVPALYRLAQARLEILMGANQAEMEKELAHLCPPRIRRSFRTIRLIDTKRFLFEQNTTKKEEQSLLIPKSKLIECKRECLLRIWDADKLEEMDFKEGHRYKITNLTPSNVNIWPKDVDGLDEIHLNTQQESRWEEFPLY